MEKVNLFWKNKKILITGITGFIGSWSAIAALENGAKVIGVSRTIGRENSNFSVCKLSEKIHMELGDITEDDFLVKVCRKYEPDIILHLAGQAIDSDIIDTTYETNILGTLCVLECIKKIHSIKACVFLTTSKCYLNEKWDTAYSKSKGCADILIEAYQKKYLKKKNEKCKIINFILCNTIGGGDWGENRLIPECIQAVLEGKAVEIKTPQAQIYMNSIFEVVEGIYISLEKIMENGEETTIFYELKKKNLTTVKELVDLVKKLCFLSVPSEGKNYIEEETSIIYYSEKIEFKGTYALEDIIKTSIEWYKKYTTNNMYDICVRQWKDSKKYLWGE